MESKKYDVIGDLHGCHEELEELLFKLGAEFIAGHGGWFNPPGRCIIFAGDFCDRGPENARTLDCVMELVSHGAKAVLGNHDWKLLRVLRAEINGTGFSGKIGHGLRDTLDELDTRGLEYKKRVLAFLESLPTKVETEDLIVVHGAYKTARTPKEEREINLYGVVDRDAGYDETGFPKRLVDWKADHQGKTVVVGHIVVKPYGEESSEAVVVSKYGAKVIDVDWGCCFGGKMAAYRYPEDEFVSVPAKRVYWHHGKVV